ncbi:MAG: hypothetical protein JW850_05640 [Thermoflexales bacterium]|nr:hypothetical protein [Thermoflexales bacterium]
MTSKADFTPEEWQLLVRAPFEVVMTVSAVGSEGLSRVYDMPIELSTGMKELVKLAQQFGENLIIQNLFTGLEAQEAWLVCAEDQVSQERFPLSKLLQTCQEVVDTLDQKAEPAEAQEFKRYLLMVADKVTRAAGGVGGFQGFGRKQISRVSPQEAEALKAMAAVLGVTLA